MIQKVWFLDKSNKLKNFLVTTSGSIFVRIYQMELSMHYPVTFSGVLRERYPLHRECYNLSPPAIVLSQGFRTFNKSSLFSTLDPHMRNDYFSPVKPVLDLPPRPNSPWLSLRQRWRYEITTARAERKQLRGKDTQIKCNRLSERLGEWRGSASIQRSLIRPKNDLLWGD